MADDDRLLKIIKKPVHRRKDESELVHPERKSLSLPAEKWKNLQKLAEALDIRAPSGIRRGEPSWRSMITRLADEAPDVIAAIEERKQAGLWKPSAHPFADPGERDKKTEE